MVKFKRRLKRIILYIGAFLAVMALTAGFKVGVFFITRSPSGPNNNGGQTAIEEVESNALTEVLSNAMSTENAKVLLSLAIYTQNSTEPVNLNADVCLSLVDNENSNASMLEKLKLSVVGDAEFLGQKIDFDINYLKGFVYAEIGKAQFKIETCNVKDDINKILSFATLKKFDINLTLPDLSEINFDPSMLSMIASGLVETDTESGKELKFNLLGYGDVVLKTDNEYWIKGVNIESLEFEGIKLSAQIDANLKAENIEVLEPENKEDFTDFSGMINFLEATDLFVDGGKACGKICVDAFNQNINLDYTFDFSDFNNISVKARTRIFEKDLIFAYKNNRLYFNIDEYKYYIQTPFDVNKIIDCIKFYAGLVNLNFELPQFDVNSYLENFKTLNINDVLGYFGELEIDEDGLRFNKNDISFAINIKNSVLSEMVAGYKDIFSAKITLSEQIDEIIVNEEEFKNIFEEDLFDLLKTGLIDNKALAFDVDFETENININATVKADFNDKFKAQIETNVLGKKVQLIIIEDTIFVEIDNVLKAKGSLSEIFDILKSEKIFEDNKFTFEDIKNKIEEILNLNETSHNENLSEKGETYAENKTIKFEFAKNNGNIFGFKVYNDQFNCLISAKEFEPIIFEESGNYQDICNILKFGLKLKDIIETKTLAFEFDANFNGFDFDGKIQYCDGEILCQAKTQIFGKEVLIFIEDETVYVNISGLKAKCKIENIFDLLESFAPNEFNANEALSNFDIFALLEEINFEISESVLGLSYNDINLSVDLTNLKINISGSQFSGEIRFTDKFEKTEKLGYIDIYQFKDLLLALKNTIKNQNISGNIDVVINLFGEDNHFDINYALSFVGGKLKGKIFTTFKGLNVSAYLIEKDIYLDILGIKVRFNIDQIPEILDFVNSTFNTNINFDIENFDIEETIKNIDFDFIKSAEASSNFARAEFKNNFIIEVSFDSLIDQIKFINGDKNATISCTNFEEISFEDLDISEFKDYTIFKELITSTYDLIKSKQAKISANVMKFNDNVLTKEISLNASLDLTKELNLSVNVLGLNQPIFVAYQNKILFVNYGNENGLKISINEQSLQKLLAVACNIFNIDVETIPFLGEFLEKENIDSSNLSTILPKIEISNPLSYLEYIKSLDVTDNSFVITLKAEKLGEYAKNKDISIIINYSLGEITDISINNLYVGNNEYINANIYLLPFEEIEKVSKQEYIDISNSANLIEAVYNTIKDLSISGNIEVVINLFGEDNKFNIDYSISYKDDVLTGHIFTTFKGLKINAYIVDKDIYLDIASIKVHINLNEINAFIAWLNNILETNIDFDMDKILNSLTTTSFEDIDFSFIKSLVSSETQSQIEFSNNFMISVEYDDFINQIDFMHDTRSATIYCTGKQPVQLDGLNKNEYKEYTLFTNLIQSTYDLIKSKQYNIAGEIKKYKNDILNQTISMDVQIDVTNMLNAFVDILGLGEQITICYENKVLYFCYGGSNGMKIAVQEHALQEILSIGLSAFNIDAKSIPFLDEFLTKEDIDTSNLSTIIPTIELGNPLDYVEYIQGFNVTDDYFEIILKADKLGSYANGKDVAIRLNYSLGKITSLVVNNLYIFGETNEFINIVVNVNEFTNIESVQDKNKYIDLSDSKDLIRAFVNTSTLNDYHINGKIKLNIDIGINFDAATVNVDARIKKKQIEETIFDENLGEFVTKQKTELVGMVELSNYPLIKFVNSENTNGGLSRKRTITIYFKDGYIYLSTVDAESRTYDRFERATKITPKTLVDNLKYYIQYLLGFTDSIQSKINEAIDKSNSYQGETDYGNIIEEYSHENNKHTIKINLQELTHNQDIGTLTVVLTTINNESTENKDYLYRLDVDLKLLDNMLSLQTDTASSSEALFLIDIGREVDIDGAQNYINNYDNVDKLGVDGEYEKEGDKTFKQANTGTTEIRLVNNNEIIEVLTGTIASEVVLPILPNVIEDDGIIKQEYAFGGWFIDENCTEEYTSGVYPRYNTTLFAKWIKLDPKIYATINFVTNEEGVSADAITGFVGDKLTLPVLQNVEKTIDENTSVLKIFLGWKTVDGTDFTKNIIESNHLTLYAKWEEKITKTYNLQIYSAGEKVYDGKVEADKEFIFPSMDCFKEDTKYYTTSNFDESSRVLSFVVSQNSVWYARNRFKVVVASAYTTLNGGSYSYQDSDVWEGQIVNLEQFANFTENKSSYKTEYTFKGYKLNGETLITASTYVMKAFNATLVAEWETIDYCTITFNPTGWKNPAWWTINSWIAYISNSNVSNTTNNQITVVKGTEINFANYKATCKYRYSSKTLNKRYNFETVAWADEAQNLYDTAISSQEYSGALTLVVTENKTLQPVWKHV